MSSYTLIYLVYCISGSMNQELKQPQRQQENEIQFPQVTEITYPYSVKIEQTQKGSRVSVHVYNRFLELGSKRGHRGVTQVLVGS